MYIRIDGVNYTKIKTLSFNPSTDVTSSEIVINDFSAHIVTDDTINSGGVAALYDDRGQLWASYWITFAERIDKNTVSVVAESYLVLLTRRKMPAEMYTNKSVSSALSDIFYGLGNIYDLDSSFNSMTLNGFCPEQTPRERLQWVLLVIGAYIKTCFNDKIQILPIDVAGAVLPMNAVYWKPSVTYKDYVTAVKIKTFTYVNRNPQTTDTWVTDGTNYYVQTEQDFTLNNTDVPANTPENVIEINDVMLINTDNISGILSYLAMLYFKRIKVTAEIVNNRDYAAGDRVIVPIDDENMVDGFIESCSFTFGLQAKSQITVLQMGWVTGTTLTIIYQYDTKEIGRKSYVFPKNYAYEIQNPYVDKTVANQRTIYIPQNENATGTMGTGPTFNTQNYNIALNYKSKKLKINSVDEVEQSGDTVEVT